MVHYSESAKVVHQILQTSSSVASCASIEIFNKRIYGKFIFLNFTIELVILGGLCSDLFLLLPNAWPRFVVCFSG